MAQETVQISRKEYRKMEKEHQELKEEVERIKATLDTLTNKEVLEQLRKSEIDREKGRTHTLDEVFN